MRLLLSGLLRRFVGRGARSFAISSPAACCRRLRGWSSRSANGWRGGQGSGAAFMRQQLPEILTRLINWLRANEAALNELIEEAIDETILQAGDFKSMALLMVRDSVLEGLFSEHVIMDKVDEFLQTQMSAEELAGELTDKLLAYGGQMSPAKPAGLAGRSAGTAAPHRAGSFAGESAELYPRSSP